jgi:hypothetical protein
MHYYVVIWFVIRGRVGDTQRLAKFLMEITQAVMSKPYLLQKSTLFL